jgi:hypothetical protein
MGMRSIILIPALLIASVKRNDRIRKSAYAPSTVTD